MRSLFNALKQALLTSLLLLLIAMSSTPARAQNNFEPTVKSLQQYETPEWFGKAKFGIWVCWNAYAHTAVGDWYARNMYIEGHPHYKHHVRTYGHPSEFGYKDIIQDWKGEDFNAQELVDLFVNVGAKYIVAMANHHDNYDLWDSKHHSWNSVNYGPKRDVIGEFYQATKKYEDQGIRWGVTSHVERASCWFQTNKGADKTGKYVGVPYDGNDKNFEELYLPADADGDMKPTQPSNAPEYWKKNWLDRCKDLFDNYDPDFFYVDGGVPFPNEDKGKTGMEMISYLYNQNAARHNRKNEAVMAIKDWYKKAPKGEWGYYWDGIATLNLERARLPFIRKQPWQTDTSIGDWTYVKDGNYRPASEIIQELVDIVSKNGNMLLNVSPMGNGKLDKKALDLLNEIGTWMKINGESIYETTPWLTSGVENVRLVKKGDKTIYVSLFEDAKNGKVHIPYFAPEKRKSLGVKSISILGMQNKFVEWKSTSDGLFLEIPADVEFKHALVLKIEGNGFNNFDNEAIDAIFDRSEELTDWWNNAFIIETKSRYKSVSSSLNSTWAIKANNNLVELKGGKEIALGVKAKDIGASAAGLVYVDLNGQVNLHTFRPLMWVEFPKKSESFLTKDGKKWISLPGINAERCDLTSTGTIWTIDNTNKVAYYYDTQWKFLDKKAEDIACGGGWISCVAAINKGKLQRFDGTHWTTLGGKNLKKVDVSIQDEVIVAIDKNGNVSLFDKMGATQISTEKKFQDVSCGQNNGKETLV